MAVKVKVSASLKRNGKREMVHVTLDVDSTGNDNTVRQQIEQRLAQRLAHTTLLHAGKQMLWSQVLVDDWFERKEAHLWIFEPEDITLYLKLMLTSEFNQAPEYIKLEDPFVSITVPSSSSARVLRREILRVLKWNALSFCFGGRVISLYGLESHEFEPFLLRHNLVSGTKVFVFVEPPPSSSFVSAVKATDPSGFGRQDTTKPLSGTSTKRRYVLEDQDLATSFFNIRKKLAHKFDLVATQTRLLFGGLDLSNDNRTPPFYHAGEGSVVWLCFDKSLMDVQSVVLKIVMWDTETQLYKCSQFDANFSKLTTILQIQKNLSKQFDPEKIFMTYPKIFRGGVELKSYKRLVEEVSDQNAKVEVVFAGTKDKAGQQRTPQPTRKLVPTSASTSGAGDKEQAQLDLDAVHDDDSHDNDNNRTDGAAKVDLEHVPFDASQYQPLPKPTPSAHEVQKSGIPVLDPLIKWRVLQDKRSNSWETLPDAMNEDIEQAFIRGLKLFTFKSLNLEHTITFDAFKSGPSVHQLEQNTTGMKWNLQRCDSKLVVANALSLLLRWEYCDSSDNYVPYDNILNMKIEGALQTKKSDFKFVTEEGQRYTISFAENSYFQTDLDGNRRRVRRYYMQRDTQVMLPFYHVFAAGVVRYIGPKKHQHGGTEDEPSTRPIVIGVELKTAAGDNNGTVDGWKYFDKCKPKHGVVLAAHEVVNVWDHEQMPLARVARLSTQLSTPLETPTPAATVAAIPIHESVVPASVPTQVKDASKNTRYFRIAKATTANELPQIITDTPTGSTAATTTTLTPTPLPLPLVSTSPSQCHHHHNHWSDVFCSCERCL
eukprot:m.228019 g.228019  ORF g.228019 m.228019 type:complete len:826 (-) comp33534_c0_seq2:1327-3804(-)